MPINDDLRALFKLIRQEKHLTSEYVFTYLNEPIKDVKRAFGGALRRANITDFRFHDLRHTFASYFVMRGGQLKGLAGDFRSQ